MLDLASLRVFTTIARAGSLTAAAPLLAMDPKQVGRHLARLEADLGVTLFARTTRRVAITAEGRELLGAATELLAHASELEERTSGLKTVVRGTVRLGVPTAALALGILERVRDALDAHPALSVELVVSDDASQATDGTTDVALSVGRPLAGAQSTMRIGSVEAVLAASPRYLDKHGKPERLGDLARHACLRFASRVPQTSWTLLDARGTAHDVPVGGRFCSTDSRALMQATFAGLGIGLVEAGQLARADGSLVRVLPGYRFPPFDLYATWTGRLRRQEVIVDLLRAIAPSGRKRPTKGSSGPR